MAIFDHFQGSQYGKMAIRGRVNVLYLETISARAFVQISNCDYITAVDVKSGLIVFVDFYSLYCLLFYDKYICSVLAVKRD